MIRNFSGMLRYANPNGNKDFNGTYERGVLSAIIKQVQTYAVYSSDDVREIDWRVYHASVVPAQSSPL